MNKSATLSRYESTADYYGYDFDYQTDFTKFLEEARNSEKHGTSIATTPRLEVSGDDEQFNRERKNKKSWKTSLLFWLKTDKKCKLEKLQTNSTTVSKPIRGRHVSGPMQRIVGGGRGVSVRGPKSGPLTGLFSSTRGADEYEVPYMCLGQHNNSQKLNSYGPLYLVT
ncbi:hypothetical protein ABFS83_09G123000 [Erythranthe nasuta]